MTTEPFQQAPANAKLTIGSVDNPDDDHTVVAQYNPKELQIDKNVPWQKHNQANKTGSQADEKGKVHLEFTGAEGRTLQIELLFDQFELKDRPGGAGPSTVASLIGILETLRRPHLCVLTWGSENGLPSFRCVINSISTKYTVFDRDGTPLRATCTVKLQEADILSLTKEDSNKPAAAKPAPKK
jgi:Contractile injection system tube protein/Phage P2 GpU